MLKMIEFFGETDPIEYYSKMRQSMDEHIDLNKLDFTFAVESIDKRIGRIEVVQIDWSGVDGIKRETPIDLVSCEELLPYGLDLTNEWTKARVASKNWTEPSFLCPDQTQEMGVWGSYNDKNFRYIELSVHRCSNEDVTGDETCANDHEVAQKSSLRVYQPEASVNYEIHDTYKAIEWSLHGFYTL